MFNGQVATIPLGLGGLHTDDPQTVIPHTDLVLANNVSLGTGLIEKDPGSKKYNRAAIAGGVKAIFDWWPNDVTQRLIAISGAGRVYKLPDIFTQTEIRAAGAAPALLSPNNQTHLLACGMESANRPKKLFVFTGKDPVQVISGDGSTRSNLALPAADWSGSNQPSFAFLHRNRVVALGNPNDPHRIYISDDDDHESFSAGGATYPVYPGQGDRLFSGFVFKGRAFLFKYPQGVYYIDDSAGADPAQWAIREISASFGVASAHPAIEILNDALIANSTGSISSLAATNAFGDVEAGDVLSVLRNESYMRKTTSPQGNLDRHAIYYGDKKRALFTYRSAGSSRNDRILTIDFSQQNNPRVTWSSKDQPTCLSLFKDVYGVQRPAYGSDDGFVYLMDQADRDVGGLAYSGEFQTPHLDFSNGDATLAERNKLFKFLELTFEPTGRWPVNVEIIIDGKISQTIQFQVSYGPVLGDFRMNRDRLSARVPRSTMKKIAGEGRRISFRVYGNGYRQDFRLTSLRVYYKLSGLKQKSSKK